METQKISNIVLSALYVKISDSSKKLKQLTYRKIFELSTINNHLIQQKELRNIISQGDYYKITAISENIKNKEQNISINLLLKLNKIINISLLDEYVHYHVVRSFEFKKDIYQLLDKKNEGKMNTFSRTKSDDVYDFVMRKVDTPKLTDLSNSENLLIAHEVNHLFYPYKNIKSTTESTERFSLRHKEQSDETPESLSIYWGTNRSNSISEDRLYFNDERNNNVPLDQQLQVGRSLVTIPDIHKYGKIERPADWWKVFSKTKEDVNHHIVIHSVELMPKDEWQSALQDEDQSQEALLFIHGYNCSFDDAIYRTAQLKYDLKFEGAAFCFSWASKSKVLSYSSDESTIDWSSMHLNEFIELITENLNLSRLHIIAHSMGNRALVDVISRWGGQQNKIHTVVLAAPDVDADKMKSIASHFSQFNNVTMYSSTNDLPVKLSKKIHGYNRAGNSIPPLILAHTDTIDVSKINKPIFSLGHSYFSEALEVFNDLYYLINKKIPAIERRGISFKKIWQCYILV